MNVKFSVDHKLKLKDWMVLSVVLFIHCPHVNEFTEVQSVNINKRVKIRNLKT